MVTGTARRSAQPWEHAGNFQLEHNPFSSNAALSADNCERLEALANQYKDDELTSAQKQLNPMSGSGTV
jgi:hypothetical protein